MPPPKAKSQGSNAAGGGALTALRAISAAKAEPETIASAVANKATFFMTIPIPPYLDSPARRPPRANDNRLRPNVLTWSYSGLRCRAREAKKASICRLFRRSDVFDTCSARVLHSHNNFWGFDAGGRYPRPEAPRRATGHRTLFCESTSP